MSEDTSTTPETSPSDGGVLPDVHEPTETGEHIEVPNVTPGARSGFGEQTYDPRPPSGLHPFDEQPTEAGDGSQPWAPTPDDHEADEPVSGLHPFEQDPADPPHDPPADPPANPGDQGSDDVPAPQPDGSEQGAAVVGSGEPESVREGEQPGQPADAQTTEAPAEQPAGDGEQAGELPGDNPVSESQPGADADGFGGDAPQPADSAAGQDPVTSADGSTVVSGEGQQQS